MVRNPNSANLFSNIFAIGVISILSINFTVATVYYPKSPDSVISEGIWEKEVETLKPKTKISQGASRLDVTGVLTNLGTRQGASMFALITFPLLFPIIILVGLALLFMSLVGTNGFAAVGRRSDISGNSLGGSNSFPGFDYVPPGYKLDRDGFHSVSLTNRQGFAFDEVENDTCMERFACELLLRGGPKVIGKKTTFGLLRELGLRPITVLNSSPGRKSRKVWKCSAFWCNWEKWIPWSDNAIP